MTRAQSIAAAILKRVKAGFKPQMGREYSLRHRVSVATLPLEVHMEVCRIVEKEVARQMGEATHDGRLYVTYGDGCRANYLWCGFSVRVVAAKNVKPRRWCGQKRVMRSKPLAQFYQD